MEDSIAVYVHGCDAKNHLLWYRIVLETSSSSSPNTLLDVYMECEDDQVIHNPVAVLSPDYRSRGGWAVIGDDIYWVGGYRFCAKSRKVTVCNNLLKHNIRNDDKEEAEEEDKWEKVCTLNLPRRTPFITAVGGTKIAIVGGSDKRNDPLDSDSDDPWLKKCGEIYDVDKRTLHYLNSDIRTTFNHKDYYECTTLVEDDPTQIVIYSMSKGSMLFLDASTGDIVKRWEPDPNFALSTPEAPNPPPGLEGCSNRSIHSLHMAVGDSAPVFLNRTLYFFGPELRLYAYDFDLRKWFQSECLVRKFYLLPVPHLIARSLVCLPNGNLLVMVCQVSRVFTMASFSVSKPTPSTTTLDVTVKHIQYFRPRGPYFFFTNAKATWLKNSGSGTMQE